MVRKLVASSCLLSIFMVGCGNTTLPALNPAAPAVVPTTSAQVIKHVVVIFGENISFDHYYGTYPNALNLPGETKFTAAAGTPTSANNYVTNPGLLTNNPNTNVNNVVGGVVIGSNPFRLSPAQALTADQDHGYTDEQKAFDNGKMDLFPLSVGTADSASVGTSTSAPLPATTKALTMGYYDGNSVTALWNYAQHYALNDHSFGTNFGPSTQGALNLVSGQINGVVAANSTGLGSSAVDDGTGTGVQTLISDADPSGDICSSTSKYAQMSGKNVGDLLNAKSITWGWFQGGFDLTVTNPNGTSGCKRSSVSPIVGTVADYVQHHEPFQYYTSTANPMHNRPTPGVAIGAADLTGANHQYDTHDFTDALSAGNMPAVSFLKAPAYQNGHAGNSDPIDEGTFVATMVNAIEKSQFWNSTAIIIAYDDSDGWYDHVMNLVNGSISSADAVTSAGVCISSTAAGIALTNVAGTAPAQGRCGYGPRLPMTVISPWAKKNYVDSTVTDQSSILRFIEDTFLSSQRIGGGSFDAIAGPLTNMFDFSNGAVMPNPNVVQLNPANGTVTSGN